MLTSAEPSRWIPPSAGLTSMLPGPGKGAPGRAEPDDHAVGRSCGGLSTKVPIASDSRARPLSLRITAGQAGDAPAFETVMASIRVLRGGPGQPRTRPDAILADRAYSSRAIRNHLRRAESALSSPSPPTRSATGCGEAATEAVHRPSTPRRTSSATLSNAESTGSGSGAAWRFEQTSSPSPTRPHSTSPPSSSGQPLDRRSTSPARMATWTIL